MSGKSNRPIVEELKHTLCSRKLSRRAFIEKAAAAGVSLTVAQSIWNKAQAAAPKSGGTARFGLHDSNTSDTLDPALSNSEFTVELGYAMRSCLTEVLPDGSVIGELASGWEASPDAKVWTFELQKGAEFHNGKAVTAQDVVDSINYHRGEESKSGGKALVSSVESVKADGNAVVITSNVGNADLPYALSAFQFQVCPSDGNGNLDLSGVGTGPYVLQEFEPGVRAELTKNPNYFKEGRAHFDAVQFIALNDANARNNALVTGEVDVISDVDLSTVNFLKKIDSVVIDEVASGAHATMPMHANTAPFDNNDVRMAMKFAIDREKALKLALKGHGTIGNDQPIGPSMPYYAELEQRQYDPDKAKYHLKKAGLLSLPVSLSAADAAFGGAVDLAVIYKESAAAAGIDVNLVREPNDGYWSNVWMKKPFSVSTWSARPTPDVMFTIAYKGGGDWNESFWSNEKFDAILAEAKGELDQKKRAEMYAEMQMIVRDEGSAIIPFFRNRVSARSNKVAHSGSLSGSSPLDGSRAAERWWFAG
ncbi:MAG: ABC transporter substrate-binding protein [Alphaproteobacteria bacterium]